MTAKTLDLAASLPTIRDFWRKRLGLSDWPGEDFYTALARKYVGSVELEDASGFESLRRRGVLFTANHQVGVESLIFGMIVSGIQGILTTVLAKQEHRQTWMGQSLRAFFDREDLVEPKLLVLVDRNDQRAMVRTLECEMGLVDRDEQAFLVHTMGTRSLGCREPVTVVSGPLIDRAVRSGVSIVPVRFAGGLPVEPLEERVDFPVGHGKQTIHIGSAIGADVLAERTSADRKALVVEAIQRTGGGCEREVPHEGDPDFVRKVEEWRRAHGVGEAHAAVACALEELPELSEATRLILDCVAAGRPLPHVEHREWLVGIARATLGLDPS